MSKLEIKNKLEIVLKDVEALPAMPPLVQKLERMMADPDVDMRLLSKELSMDPAITASLIRLSNSAYYAPTRKIRSVSEAVMTLGISKVKDIVMVIAAQGIIKTDIESFRLSSGEVWDHSLLVADLSSIIATHKKTKTKADVAFTAGLLHDVGKIIISQFFRIEYQSIQLGMREKPEQDFLLLEESHLGFTHMEAGARLMEVWNFPEDLIEAVRFTYSPAKAKINPELCSIIHLANALVLNAGVGIDIGGLNRPLSDQALKILNATDKDIEFYYASLPELIEKLADLRFF